ncbi:Hypothetical predicted protein [Lecanosticta acicola]|uniref:Metallo-beta-lactamase domain-containing protein n=1 Tax=Lecanosticta acicola TaxID=111012 RepID=A0AAI8YUY2_9PEZI|nr:Hypothetical predicted protein [Lecanosticta acicola]
MAHHDLVELDSLEILVIVDNELDPISPSPNPAVKQSGTLRDISWASAPLPQNDRAECDREIRMDEVCCSAHGLSLMVTGYRGDEQHTILFDTGPEEVAWERNAQRLKADISKIEAIQLSHWHRDHSGGMLKVLQMVEEARIQQGSQANPVIVDLHPARPEFRGMQPPGRNPFSFIADPTFDEIEQMGAKVSKNDQPHTVLDNFFLVSGEIPRVTPYEKGLKFGVRFDAKKQAWETDTEMRDERLLMCKLKGKGIVMFTGCSHAGVVNAARCAGALGGGTPLYGVMGGYHLADADQEQITSTASDLGALNTQMMLAGHCTGWRAKFEIQNQMPGRLVPSFVGSKFVL